QEALAPEVVALAGHGERLGRERQESRPRARRGGVAVRQNRGRGQAVGAVAEALVAEAERIQLGQATLDQPGPRSRDFNDGRFEQALRIRGRAGPFQSLEKDPLVRPMLVNEEQSLPTLAQEQGGMKLAEVVGKRNSRLPGLPEAAVLSDPPRRERWQAQHVSFQAVRLAGGGRDERPHRRL